jgi:hypothetical protein
MFGKNVGVVVACPFFWSERMDIISPYSIRGLHSGIFVGTGLLICHAL